MLMMLGNHMKKIDFSRVVPFGDDDLAIFVSPDAAFVLRSIINDVRDKFSIKSIMIEEKVVFACNDFDERTKEFAEILEVRLDRMFVTGKAKFIYFDEEEQTFLSNFFKRNHLTCVVDLYLRDRATNTFSTVPIESLSAFQHRSLKKYFANMIFAMRPDRYYTLFNQAKEVMEKKRSVFNFKLRKKEKEQMKIDFIVSQYPGINVTSKKEFTAEFRRLAKLYHPDINPGSEDKFTKMKDNISQLKDTTWFKDLPEGE